MCLRRFHSARPVPVGMESGAILDSWITASSIFSAGYSAYQARLHFKEGGGKTGSWSVGIGDNNPWLQVDLQQMTRLTGIATQGRNGYTPGQWVTKYKLQYGEDGHTFTFYRRNGDHSDTVCKNCLGKTSLCMISKSSNRVSTHTLT